ncbi:MAG TPA: acetyltransferase [Spirochaetota bacterium]|nr:acetyltransferase [Spirochaetota bacterium]
MVKKSKILIIGSSGHAKVIIDIMEKRDEYQILGLIDDFRSVGEETSGYRVLGKIEDIPSLFSKHPVLSVFIAIGDNWGRYNAVSKILSLLPSPNFPAAIHPSAQIGKGVVIGRGVAVMAGAVINPDAEIGEFAFINTKASAGHDVKMSAYSSLGPGVTVGGNTFIGEFTAVSIGASIKEKLKIGSHSIIGAGAVLMDDCPDKSIMYGIPARIVRKRSIGEKYI